MKPSILERNGVNDVVIETVSQLVASIPWPQRRRAMAAVTTKLLDGKERAAEDVFGWGRSTVALGMNEVRTGINCVNDLSSRHKPRTEQKHPEMLDDIRAMMEPECQADPKLRTTLAYTNKTASSVRKALIRKGWAEDVVPTIRTISSILNRHHYRSIERYWGGLERSWNGYLLDSMEKVLNRARNFTWRSTRTTVALLEATYDKGKTVRGKEKTNLESRLKRSASLPFWDITIHPNMVN